MFPGKSFQCELEVLLEHHRYYCKELLQCSFFFWVNRNMLISPLSNILRFFIMGMKPGRVCACVNDQGPADGRRQALSFFLDYVSLGW